MIDEDIAASRRKRRTFIIVFVVLVAVGLLVWRCSRTGSNDAAAGAGRRGHGSWQGATVGVAKAANADVPVTLTAIGTVQPVVAATVRTQLSGTIFSLNFKEGQHVAKGELIAQVDPRPYKLALTQAQGTVARDQAQLASAQVDLKRYQTLLAQDSIARQQVDTQAALVKQYEGTVATDQAAVGSAKLNLDYTAIKAPVSGTIGLRAVDIGNYVTPGDTNGIALITQDDPIDVAFAVPQAQLPQVQERAHAGGPMPVEALDQGGGKVLAHGRFLTFDNAVDANTGTVRAKARFANPNGALFPNQFVNVSLLVNTLQNAIVVPVAAVRNGAQGDFVFVLQPDRTVKLTKVKTGPQAGGNIAVLQGVTAGQQVVTEGADSLDDGSKVTLPGDKPAGPGGAGGGRRGGHRRG